MSKYKEIFAEIEEKWQKKWTQDGAFRAQDFDKKKKKFYCLVEFPYPSGEGLHMGHPRSYYAMDIVCRKKRMEGHNVLYPMGWDAFGLPAEHYAIKTRQHPSKVVEKNVETFRRQLDSLGISFDMSREVNTTDPAYYKWTQWMFLKFHEAGLAYKDKFPINWCPSCKMGIANEELEDGKCERCGAEVQQREKEQWMLRMTKYADRLIDELADVDYLDEIVTQQINWIGRSQGVNLHNKVKDLGLEFDVYDSIPQTFMAQTFTIIAPEHPMVEDLVKGTEHEKPVMEFVERIKKKKAANKFDIDKDMEGIFTGRYVENYLGMGRDLPIWVASFAVYDYGTGIVNCSAHDQRDFDFAKKYDLPLHPVLFPEDKKHAQQVRDLEVFYRQPDGILEEPLDFQGQKWHEAREGIIDYIEEKGFGQRTINYKLRDWVFSRQRYWGEPIPMVSCPKCGWVPVPEKELPLELPEVENYEPTDTGESPLAAMEDWVNTDCPKCGGPGKRETDTMPTWAGSSWYWLRYADPQNDKGFADLKKLKYWTPVDLYNGGMEHATRHLLYARFWHKALFDLGLVPAAEPFGKRVAHGLILAEGGQKMSKSKGNVINPDEIVGRYGADTTKTYLMFMGPYAEAIPWSEKGIKGAHRFLGRFWDWAGQVELKEGSAPQAEGILHKTIKKVSQNIDSLRFNTAVSTMMIYLNEAEKEKAVPSEHLIAILKTIYPFAPHLACELWEKRIGQGQVYDEPWPEFDPAKAKDETVTIAVQVNGKVRAQFEAPAEISQQEAQKLALAQENTQKHLEGKTPKKVIYVKGKLVSIVI